MKANKKGNLKHCFELLLALMVVFFFFNLFVVCLGQPEVPGSQTFVREEAWEWIVASVFSPFLTVYFVRSIMKPNHKQGKRPVRAKVLHDPRAEHAQRTRGLEVVSSIPRDTH